MNKELVKNRFRKSMDTYNQNAEAQKHINIKLKQLAVKHLPQKLNRILEVGCGSGMLTSLLVKSFQFEHYFINDIVDDLKDVVPNIFHEAGKYNYTFTGGDAESLVFPEDLNLIVSGNTFQWFNDFEKFIQKCHYNLQEQGLMVFNTFGPRNLIEIKELTGAGLSYPSYETLYKIISDGFEILFAKDEYKPVYFNSPYDVLKHMKSTGVTAAGKYKWNKHTLAEFDTEYRIKYSENEKVRLTYNPLYFVLRKK